MSVLKNGNDVLHLLTDSELMAAYYIEETLQEVLLSIVILKVVHCLEDWDRYYSVENFNVTIKKAGKVVAPLVCNETFDPVHHMRLFNAVRAHLHRRYWKNVT